LRKEEGRGTVPPYPEEEESEFVFSKKNCGPNKDGIWNSSVHHSKQLGVLQLFAYVCVLLP
jgi:hypothetical protein